MLGMIFFFLHARVGRAGRAVAHASARAGEWAAVAPDLPVTDPVWSVIAYLLLNSAIFCRFCRLYLENPVELHHYFCGKLDLVKVSNLKV